MSQPFEKVVVKHFCFLHEDEAQSERVFPLPLRDIGLEDLDQRRHARFVEQFVDGTAKNQIPDAIYPGHKDKRESRQNPRPHHIDLELMAEVSNVGAPVERENRKRRPQR